MFQRLLSGVTVGLLLVCRLQAETFSIAVIPDTQNYVDQNKPQPASTNIYNLEMQYLANNMASQNIVFTSHIGDVVQHGADYMDEWTRAAAATDVLAASGMKFGMIPGNHDYDDWTPAPIDGAVQWNAHFGPNSSYFAGQPWYGGATTTGSTAGMSSWQTFSGGDWNFLHLSLEHEPSPDVLNWAQNVINDHPNMPVIVSTHEYLGWDGSYLDNDYREGLPHSSTQEVWDNFVDVNPNIFMVFCGHNFRGAQNPSYLRTDVNENGQEVYQILTDYQGTYSGDGLGGGGGWVRTLEFDAETNQIHVRTYSALLGVYSDDPSLTDGSPYARQWAPFNYEDASGPLLSASSPWASDFYIGMDFQTRLVPEPASLTLLALGALTLLRRR